MNPETMKTMGTEMRVSMRVVAARAMPWAVPRTPLPKRMGQAARCPSLRAGLDALKAQPQGRPAHAGARGEARRKQIKATRDQSDGENQEGDDQSDVHGNPSKNKRFTAVSRTAARPFYPAPASSPLRRAGSGD